MPEGIGVLGLLKDVYLDLTWGRLRVLLVGLIVAPLQLERRNRDSIEVGTATYELHLARVMFLEILFCKVLDHLLDMAAQQRPVFFDLLCPAQPLVQHKYFIRPLKILVVGIVLAVRRSMRQSFQISLRASNFILRFSPRLFFSFVQVELVSWVRWSLLLVLHNKPLFVHCQDFVGHERHQPADLGVVILVVLFHWLFNYLFHNLLDVFYLGFFDYSFNDSFNYLRLQLFCKRQAFGVGLEVLIYLLDVLEVEHRLFSGSFT